MSANTFNKHLNLDYLEEKIKNAKPSIISRFNVKRIGIFGSVINGEIRKSSDVDILVEFSKQ